MLLLLHILPQLHHHLPIHPLHIPLLQRRRMQHQRHTQHPPRTHQPRTQHPPRTVGTVQPRKAQLPVLRQLHMVDLAMVRLVIQPPHLPMAHLIHQHQHPPVILVLLLPPIRHQQRIRHLQHMHHLLVTRLIPQQHQPLVLVIHLVIRLHLPMHRLMWHQPNSMCHPPTLNPLGQAPLVLIRVIPVQHRHPSCMVPHPRMHNRCMLNQLQR